MSLAKLPSIYLCSIALVGFLGSAGIAQTVPDNTLGSESSRINQDVTIGDRLVDLIEGGATRGNNLFHSFSEFNVEDSSAVYFASPDGIANILTRVTGSNPSEIFGTLGVDGTANLFLLNPNGIVFGESATLDLNGSFLATTADSYIFKNGFEYSATNPNSPPLLTINLPVGLQFGSKAEAIVNQSRVPNEFGFPNGLQVSPGHNITLLGGDILFEHGSLTASNGQIELGSVVSNSLVTLKPLHHSWTLDYRQVRDWKNIQMTQESSLDTSGDGSGGIQLQGRQIQLLDGSSIHAVNFRGADSRKIFIHGSELVALIVMLKH
jgi:filamentous hemagglutinin family protein